LRDPFAAYIVLTVRNGNVSVNELLTFDARTRALLLHARRVSFYMRTVRCVPGHDNRYCLCTWNHDARSVTGAV